MEKEPKFYKIQAVLKRAIDLGLSIISLLVLWPILLILALIIKLDSPGKPLYQHQRIGKGGRPFSMYKFRTMINGNNDSRYQDYLKRLIESERDGKSGVLPYRKLKDDPRITRVGKPLRQYYLDELPQLINIIKGDMSLVGPRPHVQLEVNHYSEAQRRRLTVRPGLTGLWQIEGKASCSFNELIQLDLDYIDHWSLWLDIKIIFKTIIGITKGGERCSRRKGENIRQPINIVISDPESTSFPKT